MATLSDNVFLNIQQPGDEAELGDTDETETSDQDGTDNETTSGEDTESTAAPENDMETETGEASETGSGASGPGFGIGSAGYLLQRRRSDDDTESG